MALYDLALDQCSDDLRLLAARGEAPVVIGREAESRQLRELIVARRSVLLVGEAGVGKTSVIHRLVSDDDAGASNDPLIGLRVFRTSTSRMISETKYLGEWQSKVTSLVRELESIPASALYVTDIWNLTSVGRSESTHETMADLLKEFIESHRISLIGEATKAQIASFLDLMPSFRNLFVPLRVDPLPQESVRPILSAAAAALAGRRGVGFDETALERAVEITDRFLPYRHQPGKAIELFERAAHHAAENAGDSAPIVTSHVVDEAFSQSSGLPMFILSDAERMSTANIRAFFNERVLGQEHALDRIVETIALYKAGLNDPARPIGTFLFVGPTGVGKTELAKALAEFLFGSESRMLRFDMSEFKDYHSFEKLIGDPKRPATSGVLVEAMRQHGFAVVLLDEFEKAHPNIADLFLQVFDDGRLTDAAGQTVDFRNTIIILTSNVGTDPRLQAKPIHGFGDGASEGDEEADLRVRRALDETFRPEFLNRIEHIVVFRSLSREIVRRIALTELARVYSRRGIANRQIAVEVDDRVLDSVMDRGFNPRFGARALKRELARSIVVPLAVALMEQPIEAGQIVRLEPRGSRDVAVRIIDTDESRRAREVDEEVEVDGRRLTLAEVSGAAAALATRVAEIGVAYGLDGARDRLDAMRSARHEPGFWTDQSEALSAFEEYNRIAGIVGRFDELASRCTEIERRAGAARARKDGQARDEMARALVRAELAVDRLDVETRIFVESDDRPALVTIRVQGAGAHDAEWLERLTGIYLSWAEHVRRPVELLHEHVSDDTSSEPMAILRIDGPFAYGYLAGEHGVHRLRDERSGPDGPRTVSAVATVLVSPIDDPSSAGTPAVEITEGKAMRATGVRSGRIRSRVTARRGALTLRLQNGASLDRNRELASELLRSLTAPTGATSESVRTYVLSGRRRVRDPRSGLVVSGRAVDAVFDGRIDAFLRRNAVALRRQSESGESVEEPE